MNAISREPVKPRPRGRAFRDGHKHETCEKCGGVVWVVPISETDREVLLEPLAKAPRCYTLECVSSDDGSPITWRLRWVTVEHSDVCPARRRKGKGA